MQNLYTPSGYIKFAFWFDYMIFYKEVAINKELVLISFKSLLSIHSPRNSQNKQWVTITWEKVLHKHRKIVKIKHLDDPDQLSKGNVPHGTNPGYCPSYSIGPMLGIQLNFVKANFIKTNISLRRSKTSVPNRVLLILTKIQLVKSKYLCRTFYVSKHILRSRSGVFFIKSIG